MDKEKDLSPVNAVNDSRSTMEKVEDWLTNTFWFHYKWYYIVGVFVLSLLIMAAVGLASAVTYDWTVVYAHDGTADGAVVEKIQEMMEDMLPETGKNRRVDVKVVELTDSEDGVMETYGEQRLYSHLNDQNVMIFVMDKENLDTFAALGYFEDAVAMKELPGLYCATNDAPVERLSCEDPRYSDYSQEFLDEVYLEYVDEHNQFMASAKDVINKVG